MSVLIEWLSIAWENGGGIARSREAFSLGVDRDAKSFLGTYTYIMISKALIPIGFIVLTVLGGQWRVFSGEEKDIVVFSFTGPENRTVYSRELLGIPYHEFVRIAKEYDKHASREESSWLSRASFAGYSLVDNRKPCVSFLNQFIKNVLLHDVAREMEKIFIARHPEYMLDKFVDNDVFSDARREMVDLNSRYFAAKTRFMELSEAGRENLNDPVYKGILELFNDWDSFKRAMRAQTDFQSLKFLLREMEGKIPNSPIKTLAQNIWDAYRFKITAREYIRDNSEKYVKAFFEQYAEYHFFLFDNVYPNDRESILKLAESLVDEEGNVAVGGVREASKKLYANKSPTTISVNKYLSFAMKEILGSEALAPGALALRTLYAGRYTEDGMIDEKPGFYVYIYRKTPGTPRPLNPNTNPGGISSDIEEPAFMDVLAPLFEEVMEKYEINPEFAITSKEVVNFIRVAESHSWGCYGDVFRCFRLKYRDGGRQAKAQ